jgi:hypothetical protein
VSRFNLALALNYNLRNLIRIFVTWGVTNMNIIDDWHANLTFSRCDNTSML